MQKTPNPPAAPAPGVNRDPSDWVDQHGDALFRFALLRVKDTHLAEDLVQDTFFSALKAIDGFQGKSSMRTWLIGILKRKVIDNFRKNVKEITEADLSLWDESDDRDYFDKAGHWKQSLEDWKESPEQLVHNNEFLETFQQCLSDLPETHRKAFTLREIDGMDGDEVCNILSISSSNLYVMMHRARSRLRKCLDATWFQQPAGEGKYRHENHV
jgi:RNA polymerase sigma-70 factor (TIGR02943 family)